MESSGGPQTRSPTTRRNNSSSRLSTRTSTPLTTQRPPTDWESFTPNEVVDFIIRGADHLLEKHFGKTLADDNVQILDPATGTGTFVTNLINHLPTDRLEHKYKHEIHANEVAILPYYIANLNIEYTYQQQTGRYLEFPNLCFVDTLDNLDWQQQGATGGAVTRQGSFNLGGMSEENWIRIQEQNEKPISVIIGNPPYNDTAETWGDGTANRAYPEIDRRIRETYVKEGTAQRTHQYDMYKRFIRWASDRLSDDGIIAFITNRAYLDSRQDNGFRRVAAGEFTDIYVMHPATHSSRRCVGTCPGRHSQHVAGRSSKTSSPITPTDAGGLDPYQIPLSQIPSWLRTLADLQLKSLGYEDRVALTGKDGGPVKVEAKTQHFFQPSPEVWEDILRIRAEVEKLRDGDTDDDTVSDSL